MIGSDKLFSLAAASVNFTETQLTSDDSRSHIFSA